MQSTKHIEDEIMFNSWARSQAEETSKQVSNQVELTLENGMEVTCDADAFIEAIKGAATRRPNGIEHNIVNVTYCNSAHKEAIEKFLNLPFASLRLKQTSYYNRVLGSDSKSCNTSLEHFKEHVSSKSSSSKLHN